MTDQEHKLQEAQFFLEEMEDKFNIEQFEKFNYNLSAFLTATRSILQYSHESALKQERRKVYDKLISNNPILKYFKNKRDINIHTVPVKSVQQINIDIKSTITIRESVSIRVFDREGNTVEERTMADNNVYEPGASDLSPIISKEYRFSDWDGEENVLELSKKYVLELSLFIENAKDIGLI